MRDEVLGERDEVAVDHADGAAEEADERIGGVARLEEIEHARDDIVAAGGLASGKDEADLRDMRQCHADAPRRTLSGAPSSKFFPGWRSTVAWP